MTDINNHANLIWGVAELLRGDYKRADYGKVILPLVVMRRLDLVMEPTRDAVIARAPQVAKLDRPERVLTSVAGGLPVYNTFRLRFNELLGDPGNIATSLRHYVDGYSPQARQVVDKFEFEQQIDKLDENNLLYQVIGRICSVDLSPRRVNNADMGAIFEELIRKFAEASNETAGEHFTPREVVRLMVNLLLNGDGDRLTDPGFRPSVYDCACGTGGMLSESSDHIRAANPDADVQLFGQELNGESYAICLGDLLVKGVDASHIVFGNSLSNDGHKSQRFDYGIANPPFGVDWSKVEAEVRTEHEELGFAGRFGPGLPRRSDGQLLFLMHLLSKMKPVGADASGGSRIAIVHNGSPLFTGGAGSNESEIRRWILENDWLESIVALPEQLFYNTGIASYVWVLSNRKAPERAGVVQLVDARDSWVKMRKSLGDKRRLISDEMIEDITRLHGGFREDDERVRLVPVEQFGYRTITVDQPLRGYWETGEATWDGVEDDKPLAGRKAGAAPALDLQRKTIAEALRAMPMQRFDSEDACRKAIRIAIERAIDKPSAPLLKALVARCLVRNQEAPAITDRKGNVVADLGLRDTENVPLTEPVEDYLAREVLPYLPGAWVEDPEGKIGYEIPFTRLFYKYRPPRPSDEIKAELRELEGEIRRLLDEVLG
jgi:type I restriction enzyme M protein